ncbi:MAG TPA: hypothetical protein IGS17_20795 [Oscillatoriales cyanobacterium M59_W2019_021]|nr:hypothetical protein [Oscillatoriales cyanobacterium M4454_W2019_049]HIK53329.1 hypothetical protein [Oscillatoriales cyanobacterium M59_W2019_021]
MGTSIWVSEYDTAQEYGGTLLFPSKPLYSPITLAAYCIFSGLLVGIILSGINIFRRGHIWIGRLLIISSGLILACILLTPTLASSNLWLGFLNGIVGIHLYKTETPHFNRAIRSGGKQARWWVPLIFVALIELKMQFL